MFNLNLNDVKKRLEDGIDQFQDTFEISKAPVPQRRGEGVFTVDDQESEEGHPRSSTAPSSSAPAPKRQQVPPQRQQPPIRSSGVPRAFADASPADLIRVIQKQKARINRFESQYNDMVQELQASEMEKSSLKEMVRQMDSSLTQKSLPDEDGELQKWKDKAKRLEELLHAVGDDGDKQDGTNEAAAEKNAQLQQELTNCREDLLSEQASHSETKKMLQTSINNREMLEIELEDLKSQMRSAASQATSKEAQINEDLHVLRSEHARELHENQSAKAAVEQELLSLKEESTKQQRASQVQVQQLQEEIAALKPLVEQLESEKSACSTEIETLNSRLEQEIQECSAKISTVQESSKIDKEAFAKEINDLKEKALNDKQMYAGSCNELEGEVNRLKSELEELRRSKESHLKLIHRLKGSLQGTDEQNDANDSAMDEEAEEEDNILGSTLKEMASLHAQIEVLRQQSKQLEKDKRDVQELYNKSCKDLELKQSAVEQLTISLNQTSTEKDSGAAHLSALENEIENLKAHVSSASAIAEEANMRAEKSEDKFAVLNEEMLEAKQSITDLRRINKEQADSLSKFDAQLCEGASKLEAKEQRVIDLESKLHDSELRVQSLNTLVEELKGKEAELHSAVQTAKEEKQALEHDLSAIRENISSSSGALKSFLTAIVDYCKLPYPGSGTLAQFLVSAKSDAHQPTEEAMSAEVDLAASSIDSLLASLIKAAGKEQEAELDKMKSLKALVIKRDREIDQIETQMQQLKRDLKKAQAECKSMEEELNERQHEVTSLNDEKMQLGDVLRRVNGDKDKVEERSSALATKVKQLENALQSHERDSAKSGIAIQDQLQTVTWTALGPPKSWAIRRRVFLQGCTWCLLSSAGDEGSGDSKHRDETQQVDTDSQLLGWTTQAACIRRAAEHGVTADELFQSLPSPDDVEALQKHLSKQLDGKQREIVALEKENSQLESEIRKVRAILLINQSSDGHGEVSQPAQKAASDEQKETEEEVIGELEAEKQKNTVLAEKVHRLSHTIQNLEKQILKKNDELNSEIAALKSDYGSKLLNLETENCTLKENITKAKKEASGEKSDLVRKSRALLQEQASVIKQLRSRAKVVLHAANPSQKALTVSEALLFSVDGGSHMATMLTDHSISSEMDRTGEPSTSNDGVSGDGHSGISKEHGSNDQKDSSPKPSADDAMAAHFLNASSSTRQNTCETSTGLSEEYLMEIAAKQANADGKINSLKLQQSKLMQENAVLRQKVTLLEDDIRRSRSDGGISANINLEYLKNVVVRYIETQDHHALVPVISTVLQLQGDERQRVLEAGRRNSRGGLSKVIGMALSKK